MASIEQEIIEKVSRLDAEKKHQVLGYVEGLLSSPGKQPEMSLGEWLEIANKARTELRAKYGEDFRVDIQSILDEIREEPTDERLGRS